MKCLSIKDICFVSCSINIINGHVYRKDENGSLFQTVYSNQMKEQLQSLPQIQILQDNFMLLTTVVYSIPAIQAFRGKDLISNDLRNIFHKPLGPCSKISDNCISNSRWINVFK